MICSTRTVPNRLSRPPGVMAPAATLARASTVDTIEGRLERGTVGPAGIGGSGDRVDLGALGLECLIVKDGLGELADLARPAAVVRELKRLDVHDLASGLDQADLDIAELGGNDVAVDPLVAPAGRLRGGYGWRRCPTGGAGRRGCPRAERRCRTRGRRAVGDR